MSQVGCFLQQFQMQHFCCFISQLLKKTTATVFILGDKILSPVHFESKTFSKGYLVDEVFSNPLNRFLTLPGPTSWIGWFSQWGGAWKIHERVVWDPLLLFRSYTLLIWKILSWNLKNWMKFWDLKIWWKLIFSLDLRVWKVVTGGDAFPSS